MFHIVEDQAYIHEYVSDVLNSFGHKTLCFSCPGEYIDYVRSPEFEKPVAVITDITMPVMSGYSLIEKLSDMVPGLRYIVMSGEPGIQSEHKHKACMYLTKPFRPEQLLEIIDAVLCCEASGASCSHGCAHIADKNQFNVYNWRCPRGCSTCENGCDSS